MIIVFLAMFDLLICGYLLLNMHDWMDLSKSHKSSTNQRGEAIEAATRQRKTVAAMTFLMLHIRSYLCEWQIFTYLDKAINNIICILHENRKTVIMAWNM
jgi:hypothetical protein